MVDRLIEDSDEDPDDELPHGDTELERELCVLGCTGKILCMCDKDEENFMVSALSV